MVQVVENRADVEAHVVSLRDDEARPGHKLATLDVREVHPVEGYPNLFAEAAGGRLDIVVPAAAAAALEIGTAVRCRIRRAGPTAIFAESCSPKSR